MNYWINAIPDAAPTDVVKWAVDSKLQCDGHTFDPVLCPQAVAPMQAMSLRNHVCQIGTFVKPIQGGGSTGAEAVAAYWARYAYGLFLFYWQDADVAIRRWKERILPMLKSISLPWAGGRDELICEAKFENVKLRLEGVYSEQALNSDTIPLIINEEVHLWKPGHLVMSRGRQSRIWNKKSLDVSNATREGSQLHLAFQDGTMREWETACPVCGIKHAMHFRYNPNKPELGGLRWDASTRLDDGRPNYNKLEETIRYQFPCQHEIKADPASRRMLNGDYSQPKNEGAHLSHESWISEAVSYDQISWLDLIKEWHGAIRALKAGDGEPMFRFVTQRECRFYNDDMIPFKGQIVMSKGIIKKREGMPNRAARLWKADWQAGYKHKSQLEHFWLVMKDVDAGCNDLLIFEGRIDSENELIATLQEYDAVENGAGVVDCSFNTKHLLEFCYRNKFNAIMSNLSRVGGFLHKEDGVRRFYDEGQAICGKLNVPPIYDPVETDDGPAPNPLEPVVINVNKGGMIANHFFIREHKQRMTAAAKAEGREALPEEYIECVIPEDVSEEFQNQYGSWIRVGKEAKKKPDDVSSGIDRFQQIRQDDHMLVCCAGIDMLKDWSGLLGERLAKLGIKTDEK